MKNLTVITAVVLMISFVLPMAKAERSTQSENLKRAFPDTLNEAQRLYIEWTEKKFSDYLDRSEYADLSDSTKAELEKKWIGILQGPWSRKYYDAINCLAAIKSEKAIEPLLKIATEHREKDNRDRWMATRALGLAGDESVVPELIHLVYHYNQNTRFWAQISLVRLTGKNFGRDWQKWGQWWDSHRVQPLFSPRKMQWTLRTEWADPVKQQQSDKEFIERLKKEKEAEPRRAKLREMFRRRIARDRKIYTQKQLAEIETLYQVANKEWNTPEAKESLRRLVTEYNKANRVGCAILYLGQMSKGQGREKYLKTAIEQYSDCWYGDGVQVGAYARFQLALYYQQVGKQKGAGKLFTELHEKFPDAIGHRGRLLSENYPARSRP